MNVRTALVLAPALVVAGCVQSLPGLGTDAPDAALQPGSLVCLAEPEGASSRSCNFLATVVNENANELSIAVNPVDPLNIVATGKDYTKSVAGDCVWDGYYVTHDGGKTWINGHAPGSPWKRLNDPTEPLTPVSKYWCITDPVMRFGADGTLYWTIMPYQCDAVSGSKTGAGVVPEGGANDWAFTCAAMFVLVSHDGGKTWPVDEWREVAVGPLLMHDKQWLATHPDGKTVLLCWDFTAGYVANSMACSVSKDKAVTWSQYELVNPDYLGYYPYMDYDAAGVAHMSFTQDTRVMYTRSADGLKWDPPTEVAEFGEAPIGTYNRPNLEGSEFRVGAHPTLVADRTTGATSGYLYITWMDYVEDSAEILVARSVDGGKTWEKPVRVNDEKKHDQFMQSISVGPDGIVDVSWLDRRDDPENYLWTVYYAYSTDGGKTFSKNIRVGETLSDEKFSRHQNGMIFLGDYRDSASSLGAAHVVWTDTRNEKADVYVATILRGQENPAVLPAGAVAGAPTFA